MTIGFSDRVRCDEEDDEAAATTCGDWRQGAKRLTIGFNNSSDLSGEDDEDSRGQRPHEIDKWVRAQWVS
ncbi:hypothetical protein ACOSQ2_014109 [Xanthoceras sorbifolium]